MGSVLVARAASAAGDLATLEVVDADTGEARNLDTGDLAIVARVDGVEVPSRFADDDLSFTVPRPADIAQGRHIVSVGIESATLGPFPGDVDVASVGLTVDINDAAYGATTAGVEALVTGLTLTYQSNPSTADVYRWLDEVGGRVTARIGSLEGLTHAATYSEAAKGLVHLGAAAYATDAAHPERVTQQAEDRYGNVLWQRFEAGLDDLAAAVADARQADGLDPAAGRTHAGASFPAPRWSADVGL